MSLRKLNFAEIEDLKENGCSATDWNKVQISGQFDTGQIRNVNFDGEVRIGKNVKIQNVSSLANYEIGDDVTLFNIDSLRVEGETGFGNGVKISVLNEGGGRELTLYDRLTAQVAYMMVTCRHDKKFIEKLEKKIDAYCSKKKSNLGKIGEGTSIKHCGILRNLLIEGPAKLEGSVSLSEGTIVSCKEDPVVIGSGVTAKHFIIQSGTQISDGVLLDNCFAGQGVRIGKQYSAENCAFFANCEGYHGEAVSIFGGPYTVTHHKSTLLIAAMFSFYNAGSGSNQSNHMYKLGPLHQGILERGSKTGSVSYMLWPSRVGAYSVVIGKHYTNFDASDFPFSYINEEKGQSQLTPAMNMFTVGTRRDTIKWQTRDRRKDPVKHDIIHLELFNPYIVGKILNGANILKELLEKASREQEFVTYKGLHIKRLLLKTCGKYYEMAIKIYMGQELIKRLEKKEALSYNPEDYSDKWIDVAGMFIPKGEYLKLINSITSNEEWGVAEIASEFRKLDEKYEELAWAWCAKLIEKRYGCGISELTREQINQIIGDWRESRIKLNNMIIKDA
ncbi:MAG: DUF4954 family protein, partial [Ignavibacteriaceae bacterium]|nr:DUF4954 family protein [Ignavibacteriaceae bacterium]